MEMGTVRILSLKKVQLEAAAIRNERVVKSVDRQMNFNEKLILREQSRFEAVRARVMQEKGTPAAVTSRVLRLVQSATVIRRGQEQLQRGQRVLQSRKDQGAKITAALKKKCEIVDGDLKKQKVRSEGRTDANDSEYAAGIFSLITAKVRSENGSNNSSSAVMITNHVMNNSGVGESAVSSESPIEIHVPFARSCEQSSAPSGSGMTISYSAKDGSIFEIEVGARGRNLQVFVLPQDEKDRRLLRAHGADIAEALSAHGYHVRRFGIAGERQRHLAS